MLSPQVSLGTLALVMNAATRGHLIVFRQAHGEMWKAISTIKSFSSFSCLAVDAPLAWPDLE